jgi:hypothetical protein
VIRFFSNAHPLSVFLLFLLGALIRIPFFMHPVMPVESDVSGEWYAWLSLSVLSRFSEMPFLYPALAYIIIFIQGLSLNGFINNQKLFASPNLLFVLSYIIFTAFLPQWNTLSPQLWISIITTLLLQRLMLVYQKPSVSNDLFILSCLTGVGSLLYKPAIVLGLMLCAGLLIFRSFRPAEWVILLSGWLLPYYLGFSFLFIFDQWEHAAELLPLFEWQKPILFNRAEDFIIIILISIPMLIGFYYAQKNAMRMLVLPRKIWAFVFVVSLISVSFLFSGKFFVLDGLFLLMLPASYYITAFLYYPVVKFYPSLYVWLVLGFLIVSHFL